MEPFIREATRKTPYVMLDGGAGIIEIKGRSIPENSMEFYELILDWLMEYRKVPCPITIVTIQLEYFNTASSKCLYDFFKKLEFISKMANTVEINWYYEEYGDDIFESGQDYQAMINSNTLKFDLIELKQ